MNDSELYKELGALTRDRSRWAESIPFVSSLLAHGSEKIRARALWLLGEMGLCHPPAAEGAGPAVAAFLESPSPLLRQRAVNALGRIGRGNYPAVAPHWPELFRFAADEDAGVRLSFLWASENIATNTPDIYRPAMPIFEKLLRDPDDRVRMEAPEIFRVLGKRRPELVEPYLAELRRVADTDSHRVVRLHCLGAIRATASR